MLVFVTADLLGRHEACLKQVRAFEAEWPRGCKITKATILRALELGLDIVWAARKLLPPEARNAIHATTDRPWKTYCDATDKPWETYRDATTYTAYPVPEARKAEARKVYDAATAEARKVFRAATAEACIAVLSLD